MRVRRRVRKIPAAALLWRLIKNAIPAARYYGPRLIGHIAYPILGRRVPLRGYYPKTQNFLQHGDGLYIGLEPPLSTSGSQPSGEAKSDIFLAVIPKGRSLYDCGVVVSPDHRLLADVSWGGRGEVSQPLSHPAMYKLCLPPIQRVAGRVAIITSLLPDNYYHWMFDILPRFEVLQRSGIVADYYLINAKSQFQKESLQVLKIPSHRILDPISSTHIEADELIVPSLIGPVFGGTPHPLACKFLRSTFLQDNRKPTAHRSLYITRADATNRRVINEDEITEELVKYGVEVVSLSTVPFRRQVDMFSEAKVVIGPHGAGLTNAVFCQPGTALIEFMPEGYEVRCFERLARFVGMEYHSVVGTEVSASKDYLRSYDHTVDGAVLRRLIRRIL